MINLYKRIDDLIDRITDDGARGRWKGLRVDLRATYEHHNSNQRLKHELEILEWIELNQTKRVTSLVQFVFLFESEADAMACRLRWE